MDISGIVAEALTTLGSITVHNFHPKTTTGLGGHESDDKEPDELRMAAGYRQRLSSSRPISLKSDHYEQGQDALKEVETVLELFKTKSSEAVKKEADEGDAESAIEYALRFVQEIFCKPSYSFSLTSVLLAASNSMNCTPNRSLNRFYLVKALSLPTSSRSTLSGSHALLIEWHIEASDVIRPR
jgi:hypothetical protein